MSVIMMVTIVATVVTLVALAWAFYVVVNIGYDTNEAGPWNTVEPTQRQTRLPPDFVGLWSLFGRRSIRDYAGSWEAAVRRLDELEETVIGQDLRSKIRPRLPREPAPPEYSEEWLHARLDQLEQLAGLPPVDHEYG